MQKLFKLKGKKISYLELFQKQYMIQGNSYRKRQFATKDSQLANKTFPNIVNPVDIIKHCCITVRFLVRKEMPFLLV